MQPTLGGALSETYFGKMDVSVQRALSKGATVILNVHNFARYNGQVVGASGSTVTTAHLSDLWVRLAGKYSTQQGHVILGMMNEPHDMSSNLWFSTAQAVINAVRSNGYNHTISVPGNKYTGAWVWGTAADWADEDRPPKSNSDHAASITDSYSNIVWEVHQYYDNDYSGTHTACYSHTLDSLWKDFEDFLTNNNAYGYVAETAGTVDSSCTDIVRNSLARLKANPRILGFSWWAGGPKWNTQQLSGGSQPYGFWLETSDLQGSVPQMQWILDNSIPYERGAAGPVAPQAPQAPVPIYSPPQRSPSDSPAPYAMPAPSPLSPTQSPNSPFYPQSPSCQCVCPPVSKTSGATSIAAGNIVTLTAVLICILVALM